MERGTHAQTKGGAWGWYVGTTAGGTEWWAYAAEQFEPMCAAFDARRK